MGDYSKPEFSYIDNAADLAALTRLLEGSQRVALDTEADSLHHYFEKVCLLQLTLDGRHFIVDPFADFDLTDFLRALGRVPLLFHGGEYDLRMMLATFKFLPGGAVFDTMLAGQLLGLARLNLGALVEDCLGVTMPKQGRRSDWSRRPLKEGQLAYAADDTRFLDDLAEHLTNLLQESGRLEWHRESCERMVQATQEEKAPPDPDRIWRLRGVGKLSRRQLAYVKEIWGWREYEAQVADIPPFKILVNSTIIDLALWASLNPMQDLDHGPRLPRNCIGRRLRALKDALSRARKMDGELLPEKHRGGAAPPGPGVAGEKLRQVCAEIAGELGFESSVLASRRALEQIALERPATKKEIARVGNLMNWQAELVTPAVLEVLAAAKN